MKLTLGTIAALTVIVGSAFAGDDVRQMQAIADVQQARALAAAAYEQVQELKEQLEPPKPPPMRTPTRYTDPAKFEGQIRDARMSKDPWGPGGQFEGRGAAVMSSEAIETSQGNTAQNQWKRLRR
jgi:hypothetical protein